MLTLLTTINSASGGRTGSVWRTLAFKSGFAGRHIDSSDLRCHPQQMAFRCHRAHAHAPSSMRTTRCSAASPRAGSIMRLSSWMTPMTPRTSLRLVDTVQRLRSGRRRLARSEDDRGSRLSQQTSTLGRQSVYPGVASHTSKFRGWMGSPPVVRRWIGTLREQRASRGNVRPVQGARSGLSK